MADPSHGLRGSGSVLLELSRIQGQEQQQIRSAYVAMLALAKTMADGSQRRVDPALAEAISPRGDPIANVAGTGVAADEYLDCPSG